MLKLITALALIACSVIYSQLNAQTADCNLSITGTVVGPDNKPLFYVVISLGQTNKGAFTDKNGGFVIANVCKGSYHLEAYLTGYKKLDTLIDVSASKNIKLGLRSDNVNLGVVQVESNKVEKQDVQTIDKGELTGEQLQQTRGNVLGDALKEISGVDVIQSGSTIVKPVIHGLYSNRILILNNGVPQEGQQWGSEHAPEIDPFIATKLSVVKGAASIRYGSDAIGGVVLVEPGDLPIEKGMNGEVNLVGMDNSRMYCGSSILQGALGDSGLSYRVQGTYKKAGTLSAPYYTIDNTALLEENYSGTIGYNKKHYGITAYYSHFYTEIGINRNSTAGNPTQLLEAFELTKPVIDSAFTYKVDRGYQSVNHDLAKVSAYVQYPKFGKLEATFARQDDNRLEFSVEVPYSIAGTLNDAPENDFELVTHTAELVWEHNPIGHITGSIGADFMTQGNIYTGLAYAPVIPNYRNYYGGLFMIEKWNISNNFLIEGGIRNDYKWQREYRENATTLGVYNTTQMYNNISATLGATYLASKKVSIDFNAGNGWRAPSVYEMYAFGVHGATSTFEVGDSTLKLEKSYDFSTSLHYETDKLYVDFGVYANIIYNYIYLQPQSGKADATIETIEGVFPRFDFVQTNALFKGADLDAKWHITEHLTYEPKVTLVFANDLSTHNYLVLIPPQRFQNSLEYRWQKAGKFKNLFIRISNLIVPEQTRVPPNSDFVPPPKGYTLFSAAVGFSMFLGKQEMNVSVQCNNLLNTSYRDYLDFFRYYTDEPGRMIQLKIRIPFQISGNKSQQIKNQSTNN